MSTIPFSLLPAVAFLRTAMKNKSFFLLAFFLAAFSAFSQPSISEIKDVDGNTKVQTEANSNEDRIRFSVNGVEVMVMRRTPTGFVLFENPGNGNNLFFGNNSGAASTLATGNTFVGNNAGAANTSGGFNTFLGDASGLKNTTGFSNTFLGHEAGNANVTHGTNTFIGSFAGNNSTSHSNTFVGSIAGANHTTGNGNTCLGQAAGQHALTGEDNTFVGQRAGALVSSGSQNVAVGESAGENFNCNSATFLGFSARATAAGFTNSTALGNGASVNANNKIRFGNTAVTVIEGQVAYTVSDGRFKSKVKNDAPGLEFVLGLRPVTYNFDYTDFSHFLGETSVDYAVLREKEQKREMGFVAQEVENLCQKQGVELSNIVHTPEGETDNYSVAYGQLVVPLVKAVQEQQAQMERQGAEIEQLKSLVAQLLAAQSTPILDVQTWPNPAGDVLNVSFSEGVEGAILTLFSADGRWLRSQPAREGTQEFSLKNLPAGNYLLQASVLGKTLVSKPLVKAN